MRLHPAVACTMIAVGGIMIVLPVLAWLLPILAWGRTPLALSDNGVGAPGLILIASIADGIIGLILIFAAVLFSFDSDRRDDHV